MAKYFSLLSGEEVRPAPGHKIIPSNEFSTLKDAAEILEVVQRESDEFKRATLVEAEKIKALAFEEGFQDALTSLNKHILALDDALHQVREDVQKRILPIALKAARKIMGEELKMHPDRIVDIVMTSLKPVTQHRKITIYVNRADLEYVEAAKPALKKMFERLENLSIQERADIEPGGCIIETEAGIINAQLENQWRALETAFESFAKK
ncbi:MAG TPA: HrpE/YscL family type III secretion apparatus protein [Chlamydiales bacterium]|jgi:type III secretion protein L|nr:HrpE/YscL family type III secretion apparatus protein [Chlamydiales bacterium]